MSPSIIRIGIADDHKTFRQALVNLLSKDPALLVVLQSDNGEDLIDRLPDARPDVLLLDIRMPKKDGIESLKIVSERFPQVRTLMLTAHAEEIFVSNCLEYGIYGFLTKSMELSEIVRAIKRAANGEMYFTDPVVKQLANNYLISMKRKEANNDAEWSENELKLLGFLLEEKTAKEISHLMHLSRRSIELKKDRMKEKARKKTIGGLLLYAIQRGIIE